MLVLFPLTAKQAKSMIAMQRAQPEIKKLQAKYKNDRQKLNEEMMKFYQENKINPLAGCLPLLVQMPIFFALFRVMRDPYKYIPKSSDLYAAFCTERAGKVVDRGNLPKRAAAEPPRSSSGWTSRSRATGVHRRVRGRAPLLHPRRPGGRHRVPAGPPEPAQRAEHELADGDDHQGPADRLRALLAAVPAGLVLYFLVSNLWRLGQQELIMRKITRPGQAAIAAASTKDERST